MTARILAFTRPRPADLAEGAQRAALRDCARQQAKLCAAIAWLGTRWVLHPQYDPAANPHHSPRVKTSRLLVGLRLRAIADGRMG